MKLGSTGELPEAKIPPPPPMPMFWYAESSGTVPASDAAPHRINDTTRSALTRPPLSRYGLPPFATAAATVVAMSLWPFGPICVLSLQKRLSLSFAPSR